MRFFTSGLPILLCALYEVGGSNGERGLECIWCVSLMMVCVMVCVSLMMVCVSNDGVCVSNDGVCVSNDGLCL